MTVRFVDEAMSKAWLKAAKDLGIRVVAPFTVRTSEGELGTYEAHVLDFGGPKGTGSEFSMTNCMIAVQLMDTIARISHHLIGITKDNNLSIP
jgi:hypothetical protein